MSDPMWDWVRETRRELREAGHDRLARAMYELPRRIRRPDEFDAMYAEALASARALRLPWVEVFLRHWRMQSVVLKRRQGVKALPEVVELLEFAHREETRECPQSVCTVQDFTICHSNVDGIGYAPERIAVLEQTLADLDPARGCFDCLNREYCSALEDDGRSAEALDHIVKAETRHRVAGAVPSLHMRTRPAGILGRLGRPAEGLALLATVEAEYREKNALDEEDEGDIAMLRADLYTRLGDAAEARAHLADIAEVEEHPDDREYWVDIVERLIGLGGYDNTLPLGTAINSWATRLSANGVNRGCFDMLLTAGRLAAARGGGAHARALAGLAARKFAELRRQDEAGAKALAELCEAAEAIPLPAPPSPAELFALLEEAERFEEGVLDLAEAAHRADPGDNGVLAAYAQLLTALGLPGAASDMLWRYVAEDPSAEDRYMLLANTLLFAEDLDGLDRLAALLGPVDATGTHWIRANRAALTGEWADCARECAALVAIEDDALNTRRLWAHAARQLGDFEEAQRVLTELFARVSADEDAEPGRAADPADRWAMIVAATVNGDWPAVRAQCGPLGIEPVSAEGPIAESWHPAELRIDGPDGRFAVYAVRTGPATAVVEAVTRPGAPVNHGDLVAFEPTLLDEPPADPAEREHWTPPYEVVRLLQPGGFRSYEIDGVDPGPKRFGKLVEGLRERGYGVWVYSGDQYRLTPPGAKEAVAGIYAGVAVPPAVSDAEAYDTLAGLTKRWEHPLAWLALAEAAGREVERHKAITEEYGL